MSDVISRRATGRKRESMLKREDCKALLNYAKFMGCVVAKGVEDEQEALAKLQGAITMFMMIDGISSSRADDISDFIFDVYQKSLIAYFEDKEGDEQE